MRELEKRREATVHGWPKKYGPFPFPSLDEVRKVVEKEWECFIERANARAQEHMANITEGIRDGSVTYSVYTGSVNSHSH